MSGMNRTDRLVAMVTYLQGRRVVRAEELARHFEVSERTIYRDVSALSEAGVPVVGEAGVGYSLVKGYHLPPVMFTAEEATALAVGENLVKQFTDGSLATPMETALLKIRSVLPPDRQDDLDRLAHSMAIEGRCGIPPGLDRRTLLPIQQAVLARRVLHLRYRAREQGETERDVEPLGIVYYGDAWYLVSWCRLRGAYRHFKLERVLELQVLAERFQPRAEFSLQEHLASVRTEVPRIDVRLWVGPRALERVRRESFSRLRSEAPAAKGGSIVSLQTYSIDWVVRWLLSFGGEVEALEPELLRQQLAGAARAVAEKYSELAVS